LHPEQPQPLSHVQASPQRQPSPLHPVPQMHTLAKKIKSIIRITFYILKKTWASFEWRVPCEVATALVIMQQGTSDHKK
jgi:hypothetical protein